MVRELSFFFVCVVQKINEVSAVAIQIGLKCLKHGEKKSANKRIICKQYMQLHTCAPPTLQTHLKSRKIADVGRQKEIITEIQECIY